MKFTVLSLKSLLFTLIILLTGQFSQASLLEYCTRENAKNLIVGAGATYSALLGTIIVHELGHAIAGKVLADARMNIHLGDPNPHRKSHEFFGGRLVINSLNPLLAGTPPASWEEDDKFSPKTRIGTLLAGPIAGTAASLIGAYFSHKYLPSYYRDLFAVLAVQNLASFIPMGSTENNMASDGMRIYEIYKKMRTQR